LVNKKVDTRLLYATAKEREAYRKALFTHLAFSPKAKDEYMSLAGLLTCSGFKAFPGLPVALY